MSTELSGDQALIKFIGLCKTGKVRRILDIGAGKTEPHAERMRQAGLTVETNDFFPISTYRADYNQLHFPVPFDAIWCAHVLEHQPNPNLFLKKVHQDLTEGGLVAITVPPLKHQIVGGHVSLWNAGLLLYNMVLAGFDCSSAMVKKYGYNISVIVRKSSFAIPMLAYDTPDMQSLKPYFPTGIIKNWKKGFDGNIEELNW